MRIVIVHPRMTSITDTDEKIVSLNELDIIEDSSCLSVHLADCPDYVPYEQRELLIKKAYAKIRRGGVFSMSGTDFKSIGHYITHNLSTVAQANVALFEGRLSCDSLNNTLKILDSVHAELDNVKLEGLYYSIKVKRPDE